MSTRSRTVLRNLMLARACVACGQPHTWWCADCAGRLPAAPPPGRLRGVPVTAATTYQGTARSLVRGLKEQHVTALAAPLADLLAVAVAAAVAPRDPSDVRLVPVPGSLRSRISRGFEPLSVVLTHVPVGTAPVLRWNRRTRPQKRLDREQRRRNVADALTVVGRLPDVPLLVVDDVITTGATVAEAVAALGAGGGTVLGATCVALTPDGEPVAQVVASKR